MPKEVWYFGMFFEDEFKKRYMEKIPCEEMEDGCGENAEGTFINGFEFANRLMIWIQDSSKIVFFRQKEHEENYPDFKIGQDIFIGKTYDLIPKLAESRLYLDNVVIFSEGKDLFVNNHVNIGEVINIVIKEQERLLSLSIKNGNQKLTEKKELTNNVRFELFKTEHEKWKWAFLIGNTTDDTKAWLLTNEEVKEMSKLLKENGF